VFGQGEFGYFDNEEAYPIDRVLAGYTIFAGLVVMADTALEVGT
jgi:hypothetical protein